MTDATSLRPRQRGFTLVELMISLVLGALVVLAATAMVVASRATYRTQDEATRLAESSRAGLELGNRLVRLAGYTNFGESQSPPAAYIVNAAWSASPDSYSLSGPNLVGSNNSVPGGGTGINGSDSLTLRFYGSGTGGGDGNILDCAGVAVPVPATNDAVNYLQYRSYNVLFVENDTDGEPALKCQRQTFDKTTGAPGAISASQTLIRGVEAFHVLYGEALPQTVPACPASAALPDNTCDLDLYPPSTVVYRTGIGGSNAVSKWANVVSVRIAMLVRSNTGALATPEDTSKIYYLFGPTYSATVSGDTGSTFPLSSLTTAERTRVRRVVSTTVFLRNRVASWPSLDKIN